MTKINYIAMDVHKEKIVVAESKTKGQSEIIGEYENTQAGLKKMIKMLSKRKKENEIKICYEAGPCGFAVKRILNKSGFSCEVIAPSLIPVQGGNRVKTDQRDAKKLARYYQAGELTMIYVPDEEQESVRNLVRSREDVKEDKRRKRQSLRPRRSSTNGLQPTRPTKLSRKRSLTGNPSFISRRDRNSRLSKKRSMHSSCPTSRAGPT